MPRDPHKLEVFQLAHRLALEVYRVTGGLPPAERFGLQAQLRRAAVSIPANLVEGCARRSPHEYQRFVEIALGSAVELRYLLDLTQDLGLLEAGALAAGRESSDHVVRALHQLQQSVAAFPS
jgi:four helix bundle protein